MTAIGRVDGLVIDGDDTIALARFWAAMFDTEIASIANEGEPNEAHYVDGAATDDSPLLRFQRVPEAKTLKGSASPGHRGRGARSPTSRNSAAR
jgi:Glyoxalase-like domain